MNLVISAFLGSLKAEIVRMSRLKLLILLTLVQSVTFIFLVSIFGLTGSRAPTAVIDQDRGKYSGALIDSLKTAHNSFSLRVMDKEEALEAVKHGELVSAIKIPSGFSEGIAMGNDVFLDVIVDNIDVDMTEDIQRALPSAIANFARKAGLKGIRVKVSETDLIGHDTDFIPYLAVSALALAAFVAAGILSAAAVAHEFESGTIRLLEMAPLPVFIPLMGKAAAAGLYSSGVLLISLGIVIIFYRVIPVHPFELAAAIVMTVTIFSLTGAFIGASIKRTLPAASLIFGLALPFYIDSGALEPERFDGNLIWAAAHLSPVYYAVGILEHAFHGFNVTPEPVLLDFLALCLWGVLLLFLTGTVLRKKILQC